MAPRIVDKEAKRRLIQKAALKVFARQGIYDFKMIEIAEMAGVGKGTLYEYFPSKNDLIVGCFNEFMTEFDEHVASRLAELTDPVEKIRKLIAASFEFCLADKELLDTLFDFYAAGIPRRDGKSLLSELSPMYQQMIAHVAAIIDDGVSSGVFRSTDGKPVASMILALLDGVMFQIALQVVDADAGLLAEQVSDMVLNGLLNNKGETT